MKGRHGLASLVLATILITGCGPVAPQGAGPGHRQQPLALSPEEELELGRESYHQVLEKYQDRILPSSDPEVQRCRRVAGRIVQASEIEPLEREINLHVNESRFEWEVRVVRDRRVNAFCLPAGKMVVFTGILQVVENDDQLATVLSHEIAHALAHHASERVAREQSGAGGLLRRQAYNRDQEAEADHIGVFLMTFAGYDPREAVRFWERMQQAHTVGQIPEILSDHPSDARRIRDLEAWVPRALGAKKAYNEGRIAPARR